MKIYFDEDKGVIFIEGHTPYPAKSLTATSEGQDVVIWTGDGNIKRAKVRWDRILDQEGSAFQNQAAVLEYLLDQFSKRFSGIIFHDQEEPTSIWVIAHNLGYLPSVTVVDTEGDEILCKVDHDDVNQVSLTFSQPFAGKARIN